MMEAESTKDDGKPMVGQASSDIPALKPYWGKPAVRKCVQERLEFSVGELTGTIGNVWIGITSR